MNTLKQKIDEKINTKNVIPVRAEMVELCKGAKEAMLLTQIIYWSERAPAKNCGWVSESAPMFREQLGFTEQNVKTAVRNVEKLLLMEVKLQMFNGHPTRCFRPIEENILRGLDIVLRERNRASVSSNEWHQLESTGASVSSNESRTEPLQSLSEPSSTDNFIETSEGVPSLSQEELDSLSKDKDQFGSSLEPEDIPLPSKAKASSVSLELPLESLVDKSLEVDSSEIDISSESTDNLLNFARSLQTAHESWTKEWLAVERFSFRESKGETKTENFSGPLDFDSIRIPSSAGL